MSFYVQYLEKLLLLSFSHFLVNNKLDKSGDQYKTNSVVVLTSPWKSNAFYHFLFLKFVILTQSSGTQTLLKCFINVFLQA